VRRSNKPPYIYWKKLVAVGITLLVVTIPLAITATKVTYALKFVEHGTVVAGQRIPKNLPPVSVLAGVGSFITNLTISVSGCNLEYVTVRVYGTNKSITGEVHGGLTSISVPGIEFFNATIPAGCKAMYAYSIIEVCRPYLFLAFVSALTSIAGATTGVLGTVLLIKQRRLMKLEEEYL